VKRLLKFVLRVKAIFILQESAFKQTFSGNFY
jgi:hypothetical protein